MVKRCNNEIIFWSFCFTTLFLLIEISFFIQCNQVYLEGFTEVTQQLHIPLRILPGIGFFIVAQLFLHGLFALSVAGLSIGLNAFFKVKKIFLLTLMLWLLFVFTIILANQLFIPLSKFAALSEFIFVNATIAQVSFVILSTLSITLTILALVAGIFYYPFTMMGLAAFLSVYCYMQAGEKESVLVVGQKQANIIVGEPYLLTETDLMERLTNAYNDFPTKNNIKLKAEFCTTKDVGKFYGYSISFNVPNLKALIYNPKAVIAGLKTASDRADKRLIQERNHQSKTTYSHPLFFTKPVITTTQDDYALELQGKSKLRRVPAQKTCDDLSLYNCKF